MAASLGNRVHLNSAAVKVQQNGEEKIFIEDIHGKKYQVHMLVYLGLVYYGCQFCMFSPNYFVVK